MEHLYRLERKRAAPPKAPGRRGGKARPVLLDLAARCSAKTAAAAPDAFYYERLETGARWLASRAAGAAEREAHLAMANRYARLRLDAAAAARRA
jgi:hypothetical protein